MIEVVSQITVKSDGVDYLDATRINLLTAIVTVGSLSSAAKLLKISYQHAWNLVTIMNNQAPETMVDLQRGGAHGGGAMVTNYGKQLVLEFNQINEEVNKTVRKINVELNL